MESGFAVCASASVRIRRSWGALSFVCERCTERVRIVVCCVLTCKFLYRVWRTTSTALAAQAAPVPRERHSHCSHRKTASMHASLWGSCATRSKRSPLIWTTWRATLLEGAAATAGVAAAVGAAAVALGAVAASAAVAVGMAAVGVTGVAVAMGAAAETEASAEVVAMVAVATGVVAPAMGVEAGTEALLGGTRTFQKQRL